MIREEVNIAVAELYPLHTRYVYRFVQEARVSARFKAGEVIIKKDFPLTIDPTIGPPAHWDSLLITAIGEVYKKQTNS